MEEKNKKDKKIRLDVLLFERGLVPSRERAKAVIMSGNVFIGNQREDKVGTLLDPEVEITIKENPIPFVSRGGLKLDKAIRKLELKLTDLVCMDVGASTGGFTDCMLQNGAAKVYSVDVGYGQLDWKLRNDKRVVCMEKTNIRYVTHEQIGESLDFASIDVSFISLTKVLQPVSLLMKNGATIVCLIKPQFEAGREKVGKKGVVRDKNTHLEVIEGIIDYVKSMSFAVKDLDFSPIKGPEGNIEYLLVIQLNDSGDFTEDLQQLIKKTVDNAHEKL